MTFSQHQNKKVTENYKTSRRIAKKRLQTRVCGPQDETSSAVAKTPKDAYPHIREASISAEKKRRSAEDTIDQTPAKRQKTGALEAVCGFLCISLWFLCRKNAFVGGTFLFPLFNCFGSPVLRHLWEGVSALAHAFFLKEMLAGQGATSIGIVEPHPEILSHQLRLGIVIQPGARFHAVFLKPSILDPSSR